MNGQYIQKANNDFRIIDLSNVSDGIYLFQVLNHTSDVFHQEKFVVKKH